MLVKSINYWSFPGGLEGTLDPVECLRLAAEHRFPAVELAISESGALGFATTEGDCERILAEAERVGVRVASVASGQYWSRALGDKSEAARQAAKADLEKMLQITAWLGCRTLLTIPGAVEVFFMPEREVLDYDFVHRHAVEGLRSVLPVAERVGVRMGLENVWNKFLLSPLEVAAFIDQFDSPFIGAYVDVGNVLLYGYPQHWLRTLGHRVVGIHFKDFRRAVGTVHGFVDLLEGDVDWPEVMQAIDEIGYDGPLVAEMIPGYRHHPMVRIANTSNAMDAILCGGR
jgi:hexulose-6-phosphate isomerase